MSFFGVEERWIKRKEKAMQELEHGTEETNAEFERQSILARMKGVPIQSCLFRRKFCWVKTCAKCMDAPLNLRRRKIKELEENK